MISPLDEELDALLSEYLGQERAELALMELKIWLFRNLRKRTGASPKSVVPPEPTKGPLTSEAETPFMKSREAADLIGVTLKTLANWRSLDRSRAPPQRQGPPFITYGFRPMYPRAELRQWIDKRIRLDVEDQSVDTA